MKPVSARREFALVVVLAILGLAVVMAVAFAPWYEPSDTRGGASVIETVPPQPAV